MICYFTGTGNSEFVARRIGEALGENVYFMSDNAPQEPEGESIGFVFPVYSWGVPPNVAEFIRRLSEGFRNSVNVGKIPVWVVMTCGDEVAKAPEMMKRILSESGMKAESIWSVIMPNNYVLLPGFDVDSREVEKRKLEAAPARIREIAEGIKQHRQCVDVTRGKMATLKTSVVFPLFKHWGIFTSKWHSTDSCVGCGICVRSCSLNNIELDEERRPKWGKNCCSCLACYHSCPRHAVEYGKETAKKGQYFLPESLR